MTDVLAEVKAALDVRDVLPLLGRRRHQSMRRVGRDYPGRRDAVLGVDGEGAGMKGNAAHHVAVYAEGVEISNDDDGYWQMFESRAELEVFIAEVQAACEERWPMTAKGTKDD